MRVILLLALAALFLAGCGGGGDGGGGGGGYAQPAPSDAVPGSIGTVEPVVGAGPTEVEIGPGP